MNIRAYPGEYVVFDMTNIGTTYSALQLYGPVSYVNISGPIEIYSTTPTKAASTAVYATSASNVTIQGLSIHDVYNTGILVDAEKGTSANCSGVLIYNNTVYNHNYRNSGLNGSWGQGIRLAGCRDSTIKGNSVFMGYGEGIGVDSNWSPNIIGLNNLVTQNTVYDNFGCQLYNSQANGTIWDRNLAYWSGWTGVQRNNNGPQTFCMSNEAVASSHIDGVTVQSNILIGGQQNIRYFITKSGGSPTNSKFINNTLVNGVTANFQIDSDSGTTGNVVRNNIMYTTKGVNVAGVATGILASYNNYFGAVGGVLAGSGDKAVNPQFRCPGLLSAGCYTPTTGSGVYQAGSAPTPAYDYIGRYRRSVSLGAIDPIN